MKAKSINGNSSAEIKDALEESLEDGYKPTVALTGFYSYGEFGRGVNGQHEFHSTTNSWVALKEK
ncbi:MAG: hypothetical protein ABIP35_07195 [Ginsengibacter sp.]